MPIKLVTLALVTLPLLVRGGQSLGEIIIRDGYNDIQQTRVDQRHRQLLKALLGYASCFTTFRSERCVGEDYVEFLEPFPAAVEPNLTAARRFGEVTFSWVPQASVDQGRSVLVPVLRSAKRHAPLACKGEECTVAVNAPEGQHGQTLAVCEAFKLGKQLGPSHNCDAIAVRTDSEWWIKVIVSAHHFELLYMTPVYYLEVRGLPRSLILDSIDKELSGAPLVMPSRSVKRDRLMALAPKRFSRILSGGWFEWAQILVELDKEFGVQISLDLLVNKQNTADPADWHLPTDQQQEEYRQAIAAAVARALTAVCVEPIWMGSEAMRCRKLRTIDGALVEIPKGASYPESPVDPRVTRRR